MKHTLFIILLAFFISLAAQPVFAADAAYKKYPTTDGKSFVLVWQPGAVTPKKWLVSLHGTQGDVEHDFDIWLHSLRGRDIGFIGLQWWMGDTTDRYYTPKEIYRELDAVMQRLGVAPRSALLEGFSRGSSNVYAVAALDHVKGHGYFSTIMANSGGAMQDYPPTKEITKGTYGDKPYDGLDWMTSCGEKDKRPQRDGCPAMRKTAEWLKGLGGNVVLSIEDPDHGHGALNINPANSKKMLDIFTGAAVTPR